MKNISTYYIDFAGLKSFIKHNSIQDSPSLLIQVFTSKSNKTFIEELLENLIILLPNAAIIGSTTDGEIMHGKVSTHKTVLTFTAFQNTKLTYASVKHKEDGFYSGEFLAKRLMQKDTKLIISFADGLHTNGEAFLQGIDSIAKNVIVAGGLAGDNTEFEQTLVFTKDEIITKGVVAVALDSTTLTVSNGQSFNWHPIGKKLTITKVDKNRVYTINDKTAIETYSHYLGEKMAEGLPTIGIEFPLITTRNGIEIARAVLSKHDDGSLSFAGNLHIGDEVQFGYGDPIEILDASHEIINQVKDRPAEAIFIYSCMARRHFLSKTIEQEIMPLEYIAPTSGFFTYGEFFTAEKKELLNQTMTIVVLSEDNIVKVPKAILLPKIPVTTSMHALINLVNVTSREAMAQEARRQGQETFETLFRQSPDGILLIDNHLPIQCNQKMIDLFGYITEKEFISDKETHRYPLHQPDGSESLIKIKEMRKIAANTGSHQFEWLYKKQNGKIFWAEVMITNMRVKEKNILYQVCRDISQRKTMEQQLYYQANYDILTGLPNRTYFMKTLEKNLILSFNEEGKLALLFLDLDGFKKINDTLGHFIGDKVLQLISERIQSIMRKEDMLARFGGDEFAIMLTSVKSREDIVGFTRRVLMVIEKPINIEGQTLYTFASIGISRYPVDDTNANNLLQYADTAMYKAKDNNGNNFQFYTSQLTDDIHDDIFMEKDLRDSFRNQDFEVYYQPQINAQNNQIIGLEALLRWHHPTLGLIPASNFIPMAEKIGLIIELDLWVMKTAITQVSKWYKEGLKPGVLALNVGMSLLQYPNLTENIFHVLKENSFNSKWLELEITESEVMLNPVKILSILETLHSSGISIAIDDFGTGYSSLSHLKHLPIDKLKIDKIFMEGIPGDKEAEVIVKAMISLANNLELKIIAEGVETKVQKDFLVREGCYSIQGYYYSKAKSKKKTKEMLRHQTISQ